MGKISLRAKREDTRKKLVEIIEGSVIHQRQRELAPGKWDVAVFGPSRKNKGAVLRVCVAEQMLIQNASVYLASVGDPHLIGRPGMVTLEELAGGDISEDLYGLEVYNVSPLRPISVVEKREGADIDRMRELTLKEFSDRNVTVIETPDEEAWSLAVLKYLDETDEIFPDPLMSAIRHTMRGGSSGFRGHFSEIIH
jgi:hypothetical protein